jgi:uncharacterized protein (UPF0264 family)
MSQLLVSVRSSEEAVAALEGGAALIDIKEPSRGALGRADDAVIRAVAAIVGTRRPVSAALGELADGARPFPEANLTYVKWGLAGCRRKPEWRDFISRYLDDAKKTRPQVVLVAYADWECAEAPPVEDVFALAAEHAGSVMLLDTHCKVANNVIRKARPTLLDWLPATWIIDLCERSRRAGVQIALAGSLGFGEIHQLLPARPDWFAVRGAVCEERDRCAAVSVDKVRQIADVLLG